MNKNPFDHYHPNLLRWWDATSLRALFQCPTLYRLKYGEGWRVKPKPEGQQPDGSVRIEGNAHLYFGSAWHECVELFDRAIAHGDGIDDALDVSFTRAMELYWDGNRPVSGTLVREWTCTNLTQGEKRRTFHCAASREWWVGQPSICPHCQHEVAYRERLIPDHPTKNLASLLRALVAYAELVELTPECRPAVIEGEPLLEIPFDIPLDADNNLCGRMDRVYEEDGLRCVHERKTTSRPLNRAYWAPWDTDIQVGIYDLAASRMGLAHNGVILEAIQLTRSEARPARGRFFRTPEQREELIDEISMAINDAENSAAGSVEWRRNLAACSTADGGQPCPFIAVCGAPASERAEVLEAYYEKHERWNPRTGTHDAGIYADEKNNPSEQ